MEDNPSTSQGMHKRQTRQWKTYCWVPQCSNKTVKKTQSCHFIKCQEIKKLRENGPGS